MSIQDDIKEYIGHFDEQIESIGHIEFRLFRKILYVAVMDTLSSSAAFPKNEGPRIIQLIDKCSHWEDKDRVSALQLLRLLEKNQLEKNQRTSNKLYQEMKRRVDSWGRWG